MLTKHGVGTGVVMDTESYGQSGVYICCGSARMNVNSSTYALL